jgi:formate--tetrahydrofolate ligase
MEIGAKLGIPAEHLLPYGHDKAKISAEFIAEAGGKDGKLILVTAINPTPAGEGKTTTTVGLGDGLNRIGKKAITCIREARSARTSASRAARPAAAMRRSCRWRT